MRLALGLAIAAVAGAAWAGPQDKTKDKPLPPDKVAPKDEPAKDEPPAKEPQIPHVEGPKLVDLGNSSEIEVPAGLWLLERAEAQQMLAKAGDKVDNVVAVVADPNADWIIVMHYEGIGYVNDDDADQLDSGELLESYKEGTANQNVKRRELGVPELFVDDWSEKPRYDRSVRRLVWGIKGHDKDGPVINFMTRILGRYGYLSVNLIDAPDKIDASKKQAMSVLAATRFKLGSRHEDHRDGDRDSGVGLTGLVLGGTGIAIAAKTGFLVKLLLVLKKGIIVIFLAIGGFFKWLFGRKKKAAVQPAEPVAAAEPPKPDAPPAQAHEAEPQPPADPPAT